MSVSKAYLTKQESIFQDATSKYRRNKLYGLTSKKYNALYRKQAGCCAICGVHQWELSRALSVDRNHKTGQVRGLLCISCNSALGLFRESRGTLMKALRYLKNNTVK